MYRGFLETGKKFIDINGKIFSLVIALGIDRKIFYMKYEDNMLSFKNEDHLRVYIHDVFEELGNKRNNPMNEDNINSPSHYKLSGGREVIDIIKEILTPEQYIGFLRGNIFKYDIRYREKGGVEDLKKAQWYKEKLIEIENKAIQSQS